MMKILCLLLMSLNIQASPITDKTEDLKSLLKRISLIKEVPEEEIKRVLNVAHTAIDELKKDYKLHEKKELLIAIIGLYSKILDTDQNYYVTEFIYDYYQKNEKMVLDIVKNHLSAQKQLLFKEHIMLIKRENLKGNS